jgi:hypothetical protein
LPFSLAASIWAAMAGLNAMKSAKEKTPSEQRFCIAFEIGSLSDIAWTVAKIYSLFAR